jgi:hypothetical protein
MHSVQYPEHVSSIKGVCHQCRAYIVTNEVCNKVKKETAARLHTVVVVVVVVVVVLTSSRPITLTVR